MEFAGDIVLSKDGLEINRLSVWKAPRDESLLPRKEERIDIKGKINSSNFLVNVKLNHFQLRDVDLSSNIRIKNKIEYLKSPEGFSDKAKNLLEVCFTRK